ncbi:TetR/AcrR family transcriptional regulator [Streptomyces inhibens]|nr:TetR/AcrR family transcriptional regulator [Streptomyces inhibens]
MADQSQKSRWTRRHILESAARVISETGSSTPLREIFAEIGRTSGTFYYHFPDKIALIQGIVDEAEAGLLRSTEVAEGGLELQKWVDFGLTVAYCIPRIPTLQASLRVSAEIRARRDIKTPLDAWTSRNCQYLAAARARQELQDGYYEDTDAAHGACSLESLSRIVVEHWVGAAALSDRDDCQAEKSIRDWYRIILPSLARDGVLKRLNVSPERGEQLAQNHAYFSATSISA